MKKTAISLILGVVMLFSCCACSASQPTPYRELYQTYIDDEIYSFDKIGSFEDLGISSIYDLPLPDEIMVGRLTDEQLLALTSKPAETVQKEIATISDAARFIDLFMCQWSVKYYGPNKIKNTTLIPNSFKWLWQNNSCSYSSLCQILTFLLGDDFHITTIYTDDDGTGHLEAANCIKIDDQAYIIFTQLTLSYDNETVDMIPLRTIRTDCIGTFYQHYSDYLGETPIASYIICGGNQDSTVDLTKNTLRTKLISKSATLQKQLDNKGIDVEISKSSWEKLDSKIKKEVLSDEEIQRLANFDAAKQSVSTFGDALRYFSSTSFDNYSGWGFRLSYDGKTYETSKVVHRVSYDEISSTVIGNKALAYNTALVIASYLLEDDFDEVGYLHLIENTNNYLEAYEFGIYFKIDGKYHVLINNNDGSLNSEDYKKVAYKYFVLDSIGDLSKEYFGKARKGLVGIIKVPAKADGEIIVSTNGIKCEGNAEVEFIDEVFFENAKPNVKEEVEFLLSIKIPEELGERKLSTTSLKELRYQSPEIAQEKITTLADYVSFLTLNNYINDGGDLQYFDNSGTYWHWNRAPEQVFAENSGDCGGFSNLTCYMLDGDYEEVGFINYTYTTGVGGHVTNYIKHNGKYYFFDITEIDGSKRLTFYTTASIEEYPAKALTSEFYGVSGIIYSYEYADGYDMPVCWDDGMEITYVPEGSDYTVLYTNGTYTLKEKKLDMELNRFGVPIDNRKAEKSVLSNVKNINDLGSGKLSTEEIAALARADIDAIKDKVNTLPDLLRLMYARKMNVYGYDVKYSSKDGVWQFNRSPEVVLRTNGGDCGGLSNFARYILDGDYEEVGIIGYTFTVGEGGGHVTNYIKHNGKYYFFDLTSWASSAETRLEIEKHDSLEAFANAKTHYFAEVTEVMYATTAMLDTPVNWIDLGGDKITYYDDAYTVQILLEQNGYTLVPMKISDADREKIEILRKLG